MKHTHATCVAFCEVLLPVLAWSCKSCIFPSLQHCWTYRKGKVVSTKFDWYAVTHTAHTFGLLALQ
jgi:hypothetical protein